MAQTMQQLRGLETNRLAQTPAAGELLITTDNYNEIFIGDGTTAGGNALNYLSKDGGTVASLIVSGNLTVNGTVTAINSNEVNIGDSIILLNSDIGAVAPTQDAGIEIARGTSANAGIIWDESNNYWTVTDDIGTPASSERILDASDIGTTVASQGHTHTGVYQPLDSALTDIAGLSGPGLLSISGGSVTLDNTAYTTNTGVVETITGGDSITVGGTAADPTIDVTDNTIGQAELNVEAAGTSGLVLTSTTGEGFTWQSAGAATNNFEVTLAAGTGLSNGGSFFTNQANISTITFDLDLDELTTSVLNGDGDFFAVVDSAGAQKKLTKANINLSGFNNDSGWTSNLGTVTSVGGTGPISSSGGTTPQISIALADDGTDGYLSSADWNTFANKSDEVGTVTSVTAGTALSLEAGSAGVNPTIGVTSNAITATQLAVTGNGTAGQFLQTDTDGTFTWAVPIGFDTFLELTDTPSSFGAAPVAPHATNTNKMLMVNDAGTALVYTAVIDGGTF